MRQIKNKIFALGKEATEMLLANKYLDDKVDAKLTYTLNNLYKERAAEIIEELEQLTVQLPRCSKCNNHKIELTGSVQETYPPRREISCLVCNNKEFIQLAREVEKIISKGDPIV